MFRVGLTGGIGSGKTTITNLFSQLGVPIIDMDILAREAVLPGQSALTEIKKAFGESICNKDNELDRKKLRDIIFDDPDKRQQLEAILHPRIRALAEAKIAALDSPYCIIVIPLLFETGRKDNIQRILVVDTDTESQIKRTMQRDGISDTAVRNILATQVDRQTRLAQADDIIQNSGDIESLKTQVAQLHQQYLDLAK